MNNILCCQCFEIQNFSVLQQGFMKICTVRATQNGSVPDIPQFESLVIAPGGQHPVVVSELDPGDLAPEGVGVLHLETHVDEVLPVVPHLDTAVITRGTNCKQGNCANLPIEKIANPWVSIDIVLQRIESMSCIEFHFTLLYY